MDTDSYTFSLTVTDATGGPTYVNGWFDWDNDGVFEPSESVFATGTFVSGTNGLSSLVGIGVVPGPGRTRDDRRAEPGGQRFGLRNRRCDLQPLPRRHDR